MLKATQQDGGPFQRIILSGEITENSALEKVMPKLPSVVEISCRELRYINSIGVKHWIMYFSGAAKAGVQFRFSECSPTIVAQMNLVHNFACGGQLISIMVPFSCDRCGTESEWPFDVEYLRTVSCNVPTVSCAKCGAQAKFDDFPEEYFAFLNRV